jgi:predicted dithiol-disulfide oxidoreductase (DUF899 family)
MRIDEEETVREVVQSQAWRAIVEEMEGMEFGLMRVRDELAPWRRAT